MSYMEISDIDECANGVCGSVSTICSNTVGSYNCTCRNGFTTNSGTICKGRPNYELRQATKEAIINRNKAIYNTIAPTEPYNDN